MKGLIICMLFVYSSYNYLIDIVSILQSDKRKP